ncbi:hypothetical protein C9374_001502 [Naegleria lovaniensis]|uniref:F-box domain-containing protein n=1 Tax=Naegleria lovaniensis TaxID=51637 RepID=A0AA88GQS4_NAELO|nr:uncharacterized protein C9374_001502 [Naegleria lovaniensis]KAG2387170.1 hypothetical protein C9374_001502 [Naegleria lovaniensis]
MTTMIQSYSTQTPSSLSLVPYEIVYQILQFIECPKELEQFRRVHSSWNAILNLNPNKSNNNTNNGVTKTISSMFWKEKLQQSSLLKHACFSQLNNSPTSCLNKVPTSTISGHSLPSIITLNKRQHLVNQWENDDCIKYWTSNYLQQQQQTIPNTIHANANTTTTTTMVDPSKNKVFQVSLKMNECGILFIESSSCGQDATMIDVAAMDGDSYPMNDDNVHSLHCKNTYQDIILLKQLQQQLLAVHQVTREPHKMTWKDPSTPSAVNSPLIPLVFANGVPSNTTTSHPLTSLEFICQYLGVHFELHKLPERTLHKRILLNDNAAVVTTCSQMANETTSTTNTSTTGQTPLPQQQQQRNSSLHPLVERTSSTIDFKQIFPSDQFNAEFCKDLSQWMTQYMDNPTLIMLGVTQLNPIPVLIVGESKRETLKNEPNTSPRNIIGFITSTFRVPEFAE